MTLQVGDRVVAESESTERPARYGTVQEVVHEDPHARYRIEWDDGRTSVYTPAAGALRLAPETAKRVGSRRSEPRVVRPCKPAPGLALRARAVTGTRRPVGLVHLEVVGRPWRA
jgi:hypothetical protein